MIGDTYYTSMIINSARKAMLDNITALDKETLQRELESHLKLEFKYKDELDRLTNDWNELEKWVESEYDRYYNDTENLVLSTVETTDYSRMLNKMKEIKERRIERLTFKRKNIQNNSNIKNNAI